MMSTKLKIGDRVKCYDQGKLSHSWQVADIYYKEIDGNPTPVLYVLNFLGMFQERIYKEVDRVFPLDPLDIIKEKIINIFLPYKEKENIFHKPECEFWEHLLDELVPVIDEYKEYKKSTEGDCDE